MLKKQLIILLLFASIIANAQVMWQFKKDTVITWNYTDGDEFNGDKVDESKWHYTPGGTHSIFNNLEQQYYTNGQNHKEINGQLQLIAKKEDITSRIIDWKNDSDSLIIDKKFYTINKKKFGYTSGLIESIKTHKYGFFECRLKIPIEKGYWPAFWLHGGYPNEEIDMMESKTEKPNQIHIDTHCPNHCDYVNYFFQKRSYGGWAKTKYDFTKEFNIIACDWDENYIKFYLNGECIGISNVKFATEKFLTINLAIPSNNGPFKPGPDKKINTEVIFAIDYIRVWNKNFKDKKEITNPQNADLSTNIQLTNPINIKSGTKTKNKLVYGNKSEHIEEIFISFFNNKDFIQLYSLGVFDKNKPTYKITSEDNIELMSGNIQNQVFNISKETFTKGEYSLVISFNNKLVKKSFRVD